MLLTPVCARIWWSPVSFFGALQTSNKFDEDSLLLGSHISHLPSPTPTLVTFLTSSRQCEARSNAFFRSVLFMIRAPRERLMASAPQQHPAYLPLLMAGRGLRAAVRLTKQISPTRHSSWVNPKAHRLSMNSRSANPATLFFFLCPFVQRWLLLIYRCTFL